MRIELHSVECIGGMRPLDGAAPFASASLVVRERAEPHGIARIIRYEDDGSAVGEPFSFEEWLALCAGDHSHAFAGPVPAQMGARMWLFRRNFHGRRAALSELRAAEVIVGEMHDAGTDTDVVLVRENGANRLRDGWAEQAFERAVEQARAGCWDQALAHAMQAFVTGRGPIARHWALLARCYDRVGRAEGSAGIIHMACRSHGMPFGKDVLKLREVDLG